jgi:hypothetical protein
MLRYTYIHCLASLFKLAAFVRPSITVIWYLEESTNCETAGRHVLALDLCVPFWIWLSLKEQQTVLRQLTERPVRTETNCSPTAAAYWTNCPNKSQLQPHCHSLLNKLSEQEPTVVPLPQLTERTVRTEANCSPTATALTAAAFPLVTRCGSPIAKEQKWSPACQYYAEN